MGIYTVGLYLKLSMKYPALLLTVSLALTGTLASDANAQQELFALGRFNKIWRLDAYTTSTPVPVEIVTWTGGGSWIEPSGLEVDPVTGDFFVLNSSWIDSSLPFSEILRVDPITGQSVVEMTLPGGLYSGLDRRWDGRMYTIREGKELWLLDLATGTWIIEDLNTALLAFHPAVAIKPDGSLYSEHASQAVTLDPISGNFSQLGIPSTSTLQFGFEVDLDGTLYAIGGIGDVHRYDTQSGSWVTLLTGGSVLSNGYDLAFSKTAGGVGFLETCNGLPNSTGVGSTLELLGTSDTATNQLELISRNLPPGRFGFYVMSASSGSTPVGSGVLCLGAPQFRYSSNVLFSSPKGTVRFPLDLNQLANNQAAQPGNTYFFQFWHRDVIPTGTTSNLSNTVSVTFQ